MEISERIGRTRCCRPELAMREPHVILSQRSHRIDPEYIPLPGICLIRECTRRAIKGDSICRKHARRWRHYCKSCGVFIRSDVAYDRANGTHCLPCWNKTEAGVKWRRKCAGTSLKKAKIKRRAPVVE